MGSPKPVIFISYGHKDRKWLDFVQGHLEVAVTNDHLQTWDDRRIAGGADWEQEIDAALTKCAAFILLVSRHSLVSRFILKREVQAALEAHWQRGVRIYPIVVQACDLQAVPWLTRMNLRPRDAKALARFSPAKRDEVMAEIAAEIRGLVTGQPAGPATLPPAKPPADGLDGAKTDRSTDRSTGVPSDVIVPAASRADSRTPYLRLTQFEARTQRASDDSDAALLSAYRTDVVPLLGREHALDDLRRWLASDRDVSVRVLTGGAGRGKTRLALEFVRDAAGKGWLAGFVEDRELDRFRDQQNVAEWAWDKPVFIVVDYAASRTDPLRDWIGEFAGAPPGRPPLRLLLLERQAQREIGWLATVAGQGQDDRSRAASSLLDPPEPVELAAIDDLPSRRQIFATLLARKRPGLVPPQAGADAEFDRLLQHEKWSGDPLFLMMAGLVAGTHGISNALALTGTELAAIIAQRELDRIGAIAAGAGIDAGNRRHPGFLARHAAVLATLCQGLTLADARTLIEAEAGRLKSQADINTTVAALRDGLPGTGGGQEIAPILPDIVGEASIMCWLGESGVLRGLGIDPLASINLAAATALDRTSQALVRTAQDFAAAGRDEPVQWLAAIAQATEADVSALMTIADALPLETLAMRELAAELAQSIVDRLRNDVREGQATEATLGKGLTKLGVRLGRLGRREEALAASQEAVAIYRRVAETRPDTFLPDLAGNLNNLGNRLSDLGRREEALAASQESVAIRRRLAETRPDAFLPDLAGNLSNLGLRLSDLGRREEALAASQEAVAIIRRLAEIRPDAFLPDLARSLHNLGMGLSDLGHREEALAASQETVAIVRRLAETRPDAFLLYLALSLNNLGNRLSDLGRREEALAASQEAVAIYQRLAETRSDALLPDLATTISVMSDALAALDRHEEAAQAATQALEILAPFVERYRQTYQGLARTIADDVRRYSEAAGQPPDNALLARVARALGDDPPAEAAAVSEALQARTDAILDAARKTGALDEGALAGLPPELAGQVRAAWAAAHAGSGKDKTGKDKTGG
jgi:tetratricopeptide (TPR) repeat protein